MNILIKLTCLVGLVIAPILGGIVLSLKIKRELCIDVKTDSSDSTNNSIVDTLSIDDADTLMNEEILIDGENPNVDSIVNAANSVALDSL